MASSTPGLLDWPIAKGALVASLRKLDPRELLRNPVILVRRGRQRAGHRPADRRPRPGHAATRTFEIQIAIWLWLTVLFANFAEALAEGRGKAQADALRKTRTDHDGPQARRRPRGSRCRRPTCARATGRLRGRAT